MEPNWLLLCPLVANLCFSVMMSDKENMVCEPMEMAGRICMSCSAKQVCPSTRLRWSTCFRYVKQHNKAGELKQKRHYKDCTSLESDVERNLDASLSKNDIANVTGNSQVKDYSPSSESDLSTQNQTLTESTEDEASSGSDNASGDQNQTSPEEAGINLQSASQPDHPDDMSADKRWDESLMDETGMGNDSTRPYISDVKIQITIIPKGLENSTLTTSTTPATNPEATTTTGTVQATTATSTPTGETSTNESSLDKGNSTYLERETQTEEDFDSGTESMTASSFSGLNAGSSAGEIRPKASRSSLLTKDAKNYFNDTGLIQLQDHMKYNDLNGSSIRSSHLIQNVSSFPHYMDQRVEFELALFEYSLVFVSPFVAIAIMACCCKIRLKKRCNPTYWIRRYFCDLSNVNDDEEDEEDEDQEEESPV